jgi:hypothetical protein
VRAPDFGGVALPDHRLALELGEPALEEPPFGVCRHELERPAICVAGLVDALESSEKLGPRRVQVVVLVELEAVDERECTLHVS